MTETAACVPVIFRGRNRYCINSELSDTICMCISFQMSILIFMYGMSTSASYHIAVIYSKYADLYIVVLIVFTYKTEITK
jgi:hypothetical protein